MVDVAARLEAARPPEAAQPNAGLPLGEPASVRAILIAVALLFLLLEPV